MPRSIPKIQRVQLETLHTGSLLTRLNLLRSLPDSAACCDDYTHEEITKMKDEIAFKDTSQWISAYSDLKEILSTREHIERGSKKKRQLRAHQNKHR